jgi:hypothetical protein
VAFGGPWLLDQVWARLGIGAIMTAGLGKTRRDASAERVLFALVANRALDPSSKLAAAHDTTSTYFVLDEEDEPVLRDRNGEVTGDAEKAAEGRPAGFRAHGKSKDPAAAGDLTPHRLLEPDGPQTPGAGEVAAVPASDHRQRRDPRARAKRLPGRIQGRRPRALQQVPHLLDLGRRPR